MFYKKVARKGLATFTCKFIKKETPTQVYFCEFREFLKKPILQNTFKWLVLSFAQFYVSLHNSFHQAETLRKEIIIF